MCSSTSTTPVSHHHTLLSAGGLVTSLSTESRSSQLVTTTSVAGSTHHVAFSPPILVHSPELSVQSPSALAESLSMTTDPSQVSWSRFYPYSTLDSSSRQFPFTFIRHFCVALGLLFYGSFLYIFNRLLLISMISSEFDLLDVERIKLSITSLLSL